MASWRADTGVASHPLTHLGGEVYRGARRGALGPGRSATRKVAENRATSLRGPWSHTERCVHSRCVAVSSKIIDTPRTAGTYGCRGSEHQPMPRCTADALRRTWANREQSQATLQGTAALHPRRRCPTRRRGHRSASASPTKTLDRDAAVRSRGDAGPRRRATTEPKQS
jgi:hypothetical protein